MKTLSKTSSYMTVESNHKELTLVNEAASQFRGRLHNLETRPGILVALTATFNALVQGIASEREVIVAAALIATAVRSANCDLYNE